ncbi:hypothetical protein [Pannonibacter sp. SL95]|nr:hypothetical protein [Pannonibacter sp. SL95]MCY1705424.1 hypothetical protein [Pannonibacter sp. SL95]
MSIQDRYDVDASTAARPSPWPLVAATVALGGIASLLLSAFLG